MGRAATLVAVRKGSLSQSNRRAISSWNARLARQYKNGNDYRFDSVAWMERNPDATRELRFCPIRGYLWNMTGWNVAAFDVCREHVRAHKGVKPCGILFR
jgi:hypothetical protein